MRWAGGTDPCIVNCRWLVKMWWLGPWIFGGRSTTRACATGAAEKGRNGKLPCQGHDNLTPLEAPRETWWGIVVLAAGVALSRKVSGTTVRSV
jgi:hypothetical protein